VTQPVAGVVLMLWIESIEKAVTEAFITVGECVPSGFGTPMLTVSLLRVATSRRGKGEMHLIPAEGLFIVRYW
jgi:hypothetical protein